MSVGNLLKGKRIKEVVAQMKSLEKMKPSKFRVIMVHLILYERMQDKAIDDLLHPKIQLVVIAPY